MTDDEAARLEGQVEQATSDAERARARFDLALYHERAGRYEDAIPHYEAALAHEFTDKELRAQCTAWLANSLSAVGRSEEALQHLVEAHELTDDTTLQRFIQQLERRARMDVRMTCVRDKGDA